jgi:hypothetical protein
MLIDLIGGRKDWIGCSTGEFSGEGGGPGTVALAGKGTDAIGIQPVPTALAPPGTWHSDGRFAGHLCGQSRRITGSERMPRRKLE